VGCDAQVKLFGKMVKCGTKYNPSLVVGYTERILCMGCQHTEMMNEETRQFLGEGN
jgi:hypothetical protein